MTRSPCAALSLLAVALAACASAAATPPSPPAPTGSEGASDPDTDFVHHGHAHHRFDDAEAWARRFDDPSREAWQQPERVIELMEIAPGMTVADLGAGTGYFLAHLSGAVGAEGTVLALDVEPAMIRHMDERATREGLASVETMLIARDDPGLPPRSVDRVLVVNTWHHLPDREAYGAKLAAALRPGGALVVVDFTLETELGPPPAARIPPAQVERELRAAGLEVQVEGDALPEQYVVIARAPR
jgi:predicted methyltransferase